MPLPGFSYRSIFGFGEFWAAPLREVICLAYRLLPNVANSNNDCICSARKCDDERDYRKDIVRQVLNPLGPNCTLLIVCKEFPEVVESQ
jgi:hypothetical protein